ncbi:MAG: hypothetical protein K8S99_13415 [Planctomycetes bacterium]|nr:hypothetical protein [Planctomycetota bacterium]
MMGVDLDRRGRVRLWTQIALPLSAALVWEHTERFATFTTLDPFHGRMEIDGPLRAGSPMRIGHGYFGIRLTRRGRVLRWEEGVGYAFSDLSLRGPGVGFPHIYEYRIVPTGAATCLMVIRVRGKWTARFIPRPLVKLWLGWVTLRTGQMVENHLIAAEVHRCRAARSATA